MRGLGGLKLFCYRTCKCERAWWVKTVVLSVIAHINVRGLGGLKLFLSVIGLWASTGGYI